MPKAFWNDFESVVGTYTIGEDFTSATEYICNYMINAVSAVLNYPLWYSIIDVFANATVPTNQLAFAVDDLDKTCHDPTLMGVFTENHDVARLHHLTDDLQHVRNALVFALLSDGIPILYYGAEQAFSGGEDPGNREALWLSGYNTSAPLYQLVKKVNFARNAMVKGATYTYWSPYWTHKTRFIYAEDDVVAVRKGYDKSIVSVITNKASGFDDIGPFEIGDTNFHAQAQIVDVLTCNTKTTGDAGVFDTTVKGSEPQVRRALFVKEIETAHTLTFAAHRSGSRHPTSTARSRKSAPTSRSREIRTRSRRRRVALVPTDRRPRSPRPRRRSPAASRY